MLKLILFDLYGTLVDIETAEAAPRTSAAFASWLAARFTDEAGLSAFDHPLVQDLAGMGDRLPLDGEPDLEPVLTAYLARVLERPVTAAEVLEAAAVFRACSRRRLAVIPGTFDALLALRERFMIGLVSNAQVLFTRPELDMLGFRGLFDLEVVSSAVGWRKPAPAIFQAAVDRASGLGKGSLRPDEVLFVGNDPFADVDGAASFGMYTCRVRDPLFDGLYSQTAPSLHVERVSELSMLLLGPEVPAWAAAPGEGEAP